MEWGGWTCFGRGERVVARLLEQKLIFRAGAAIVGWGAPSGKLGPGPVDDPRAGRVHPLDRGKVEHRRLRLFHALGQRIGAGFEPRAKHDRPVARQRQNEPVGAGLAGDGRRDGQPDAPDKRKSTDVVIACGRKLSRRRRGAARSCHSSTHGDQDADKAGINGISGMELESRRKRVKSWPKIWACAGGS